MVLCTGDNCNICQSSEMDWLVTVTVAEMVANLRDGPVEHLVSQDVILLPKLVTVRPATEQPPSSSSSAPLSGDASAMHHYNNKVTGHYITTWHSESRLKFCLQTVCQTCFHNSRFMNDTELNWICVIYQLMLSFYPGFLYLILELGIVLLQAYKCYPLS